MLLCLKLLIAFLRIVLLLRLSYLHIYWPLIMKERVKEEEDAYMVSVMLR